MNFCQLFEPLNMIAIDRLQFYKNITSVTI